MRIRGELKIPNLFTSLSEVEVPERLKPETLLT